MPVETYKRRLRAGGFVLLLGGLLVVLPLTASITHPAAPPPSPHVSDGWIDDGEAIYMARCAACHQTDGKGINGVFPPLDGTEWVVGDKGRLIRIVLHGLMGETEVQGVVYNGVMPPWKTFMTDEEIAAVLTYVRSAWTNDAPAVTAAEAAAVRAATKDRTASWTAEELKQDANIGIPGSSDVPGAPADTTRSP